MQPSPGTQLKINQFLRALPPARELDSDCFIVEPADRKGNQCSNAPADSKVVDPATPRRHPKINDVDDDDEPLALPQAYQMQEPPDAQLQGDKSASTSKAKRKHAATPKRHPKINDDDDDDESHAVPQANPMLEPPETQLQSERSASSSKAKRKLKRQKATSTVEAVKITHSMFHNVKVY